MFCSSVAMAAAGLWVPFMCHPFSLCDFYGVSVGLSVSGQSGPFTPNVVIQNVQYRIRSARHMKRKKYNTFFCSAVSSVIIFMNVCLRMRPTLFCSGNLWMCDGLSAFNTHIFFSSLKFGGPVLNASNKDMRVRLSCVSPPLGWIYRRFIKRILNGKIKV